MAGRIRPEDIETVRERTDIVAVISGYLQLKKAGGDRLVGLCPFHAEKTPSLSVSPSKQLYYCFGCGEGGNVFTFLVKLENLTFAESVERLAGATGITLRYEGPAAAGPKLGLVGKGVTFDSGGISLKPSARKSARPRALNTRSTNACAAAGALLPRTTAIS